jgi:hypothetical protein
VRLGSAPGYRGARNVNPDGEGSRLESGERVTPYGSTP